MRPVLAAALLALAVTACRRGDADAAPGEYAHIATVPVPAEHADGKTLFDAHCASCHGNAALGSEQGPPLVHRFYVPSHHGDAAFQLAAARGVPAHHWRFGDMPPVSGVTQQQVAEITAYIRWLQQTAGLR